MERLLTVDQLADRLQVKPRTIYQWVHERYIPTVKLGSLVRFSPARVSEWLEKREVPGRVRRSLAVDIE
ncbi:MAG: helix-turn-helix domain-containing protein [Elusimicrobiota bacterium]